MHSWTRESKEQQATSKSKEKGRKEMRKAMRKENEKMRLRKGNSDE
jgi:hypothetical protein